MLAVCSVTLHFLLQDMSLVILIKNHTLESSMIVNVSKDGMI